MTWHWVFLIVFYQEICLILALISWSRKVPSRFSHSINNKYILRLWKYPVTHQTFILLSSIDETVEAFPKCLYHFILLPKIFESCCCSLSSSPLIFVKIIWSYKYMSLFGHSILLHYLLVCSCINLVLLKVFFFIQIFLGPLYLHINFRLLSTFKTVGNVMNL